MLALFSLLAGASFLANSVWAATPPQCALTCATNAATNSTCGSLSNLACLCNNEAFFDAAGACTIETCPPADVAAAEAALQSICKPYATTSFSLDTSTLSYTGSPANSTSSPVSTTSHTGSGTHTTTSGNNTKPTGNPTSTSTSVTTPTSTTSKGAAGKRAEILGSIAGAGAASVLAALGMVAGTFALAF